MNHLTTAEMQILEKIGTASFSYFDNGVQANSHTYTEYFAEEIADLLGINENAAGGHITNLIKKGIFNAFTYEGCKGVELTAFGVDAVTQLRERVGA